MLKPKKNILRVAILIDQSREYERRLSAGIQRFIHLHGPWMLYRVSPSFVCKDGAFSLQDLIKWKPNGIIVRENYYLPPLLKTNTPLIYCGYDNLIPEIPGIYANDKAIGIMGAEYFLAKGLKNFAYCSLKGYYWSENRLKAFQIRLNKSGFKTFIYHHSRPEGNQNWQSEPRKIAQWLLGLPKPLGMMAATDEISLQVVEAAKIATFSFPKSLLYLG